MTEFIMPHMDRMFLIYCYHHFMCMIKIFRGGGEGVVDVEGDSSKRRLKWGGGGWGSLKDLSKNILK